MINGEVREMTVRSQAEGARQAALKLAILPDAARVKALRLAAEALKKNADSIFAANDEDLANAKSLGLAMPLVKRLGFDGAKLEEACAGLESLAALPDPLGKTQMATEVAQGLALYRVSCPIGVVGVIFESRPDALVQIASLALRSGNAVLLKGGREAIQTNRALFACLDGAFRAAGVPTGWGALLETRGDVAEMLALDDCIDLIIPRGSNDFVRYIIDNSRIPVLGHADGVCHVYVDRAADICMARDIVVDSKTQYPAVCNAVETLLVHRDIAPQALAPIAEALAEKGVTIRGCEKSRRFIDCEAAVAADWDSEYLDLILSIKVVDSLEEAVGHINLHGSGHTDAIVTEDADAAKAFCARVDSAGVFWNCSTRFSDGYRYGFGAEVGISTGKLHARGPMGIEGLCTYKYKLIGQGQTVGGGVTYTHRPLENDCPLEDAAQC